MEASLVDFKDEPHVEEENTNLSSISRRLVPWLNWSEWLFVKDALFSHSPHSVSSALNRLSAWRSRGTLPVLIDVTASIVEIQHMDPFFRQDKSNDASCSEETLAMLYCMAIVRLVNGAVEKSRRKEEVSIAVAAEAIGIPRMLIDIRHEGSHRELPSLKVVRGASIKALDWLKSYYWEPQTKAIPFQGDVNAEVRKEIKSKIRELAICLKVGGSPQSDASLLKGKRVKHGELLFGRNKVLSLMIGKSQTSRLGGSKKPIARILKSIIRLYSSYSSEIVSVLLDYLLKTLSSSEFKSNADDASVGLTIESVLADWKLVILKLYNKEPELLLNLLKGVLDMIEAQEDMKCEEDNPIIVVSHLREEFCKNDYLSSLFAWLVLILGRKHSTTTANMPKRVLRDLLHRCLLTSRLCNKQLMDSAFRLTQLMDARSLSEKVQKLSLIAVSNSDNADDQSSLPTLPNIPRFEESMREASKKLELVKQQIMKNKRSTAINCETEKSQVWTLAKSWNPCPIGMLPRAVGSSGRLPALDIIDIEKHKEDNQVSERKQDWKLIRHSSKRDATSDLQLLENSTVKKMRETKEFGELDNEFPMEGEKGYFLVGGVRKRILEEELLAIKSCVSILV